MIFLCTFPPGANLEIEGLGRYFGSLFQSATVTNLSYDFVIATFPWHRRWAIKASAGSIFRVDTHLPIGMSGIALFIWSFRGFKIGGLKRKIKMRLLNKQSLIYNIHVVSAGVLPYSLEHNILLKLLLPVLRIGAKTILFISVRLFKEKKLNFEVKGSEKEVAEIKVKEVDFARIFFDKALKGLFDKMVRRYGRKNAVLVSMNNRFELKDSPRSILLVPDVIPVTHQNIFELDNSRWNALIQDIKNACLNSKNWITFASATQKDAEAFGVLPPSVDINVIPHASVPPGISFQEFVTIRDRGLSSQWIDYHWRAGQVKVRNELFRFPSFNQNLVYMIYPTQYRPHKNVELLIDSWVYVVEFHPEYKLVLTLDESKHLHLQQRIVELGLSNSIIFVPSLTDSELLAWQARAKFVISASSIEGAMPFMVSESISIGTPFLVPATFVSKEVLPKAVLRVSELSIETPEALSKSLLTAIGQRDKISKVQEEWSKSYSRSWNDVWRDWIKVIERVTEK